MINQLIEKFCVLYYVISAYLEIYNECKKYLQQDSGSCRRLVLGLGLMNGKFFVM
jgi:hypothetical protein